MNVKSYLLGPDSQFSSKDENHDPKTFQSDKIKFDISALKFDNRLLRILSLLRDIHQLKNHPKDFSLIYLIELFDNEVSEKKKSLLIREINSIGYGKLKATFEKITKECESYLCESENLFGILKRHQFRKEIPDTDKKRLKQIIQFLHITLIHFNILHNSKNKSMPEKIIAIKNKAFETLEPFINKVEEILEDMFTQVIINKKDFLNYETIHSNRYNNSNDNDK